MIKFGVCLTAIFLFCCSAAFADMTSITVAASVRSFDTKTITLQVNKKRVVVPRKMVAQNDLHTGDAIMVTFKGNNIRYLFSGGDGAGEQSRNPASEKKTH